MMRHHVGMAFATLLGCSLFVSAVSRAQQQKAMDNVTRGRISDMLRTAHDEVQKHYYDPNFHGLDWDARYKKYAAALASIQDPGEGLRVVAAYLAGLKDSHTYFDPPSRVNRIDLGYQISLVGDSCFVTQIRPKTDAEKKLHIGDQVLSVAGYTAERKDFLDLIYMIEVLVPQRSLQLGLRSPDGSERMAAVDSIVIPERALLDYSQPDNEIYDLVRQIENEDRVMRTRYIEREDVTILKMPEFNLDMNEVEKAIGVASKHKTLILDLRGNPGGDVDTLKWMIGEVFDHDVKIGDQVGRKNTKPMIAKPHGKRFDGKLIVLVDADSASASELFARVVQLEHRGTIIGDATAGAVMEARFYPESTGADTVIPYGLNVTSSDLIMTDGKSLEKVGVTPDELILPTAADLAAGRDPVLARAAELAGIKLDPVAAGKMFPFEWMPLQR